MYIIEFQIFLLKNQYNFYFLKKSIEYYAFHMHILKDKFCAILDNSQNLICVTL